MIVGREQECARLRSYAARTLEGHGAVVLLAGEAGVGKTTLTRSALADSGLHLVEGVGVQGGAVPFGVIVEVLRGHLRAAGGGRLVEGPLAAHLALLLPELGEPTAGSDRATLFEALRLALAAIAASRPTAVLLDDLHWADEASLQLLPALARAAAEQPLLVVGIYRSDDLPREHRIRQLRGELRRAGRLEQITVEPLDADATGVLLERTLGRAAPALRQAVFDRTGGVPFFVTELASALAAGGRLEPGPAGWELLAGADVPLPDSVRDAVLLRASGLSDEGRAAICAAAVTGEVFDPDLVTTVAELPAWPDELVRRGLVAETAPGRMAFRHGLVRDAFYREIPWTQRLTLHRTVARLLEAQRARPAVIAEHWTRGRQPEQAREWYLAAVEASCAVHAYRDGARAAHRALEIWPEGHDEPGRLDVLDRLARCAELAGDLAEAVTARREIVDGRRAEGDPAPIAYAYRALAAALELQGRWQEALAGREQAATSFALAGRPGEAGAERFAAAGHLRSAGSFRAALSLLETARGQAEAAADLDLQARILGHEGNVRARMGEGPAAVELVRAGLAMALDHGLASAAADIYQRLADAIEHTGDYAAAKKSYNEAISFCATNSLEPHAQLCLACLTAVLRHSGDWNRAGALCRQVIASPVATPHARAVATGILGSILGHRGQAGRARPLLLESVTIARHLELVGMELLAMWGLAVVDADAGATESAAGYCRSIVERWKQTEDRHYVLPALRWATTFFAETGDATGVRTCAAALAQIAAGTGQSEAASALAHALGETALLDGAAEQAADQFGRALVLLQGAEIPFDRAESHRRAAGALVELGRRAEAVEHLVAALRTARRLGAQPLVQRLTDELEALGEKPDQRRGTPGSLTRREAEVMRLVAAGRTSRDIARELFLSPRTVEMHVGSILQKLDCRSRADAVRRAAELGLLA